MKTAIRRSTDFELASRSSNEPVALCTITTWLLPSPLYYHNYAFSSFNFPSQLLAHPYSGEHYQPHRVMHRAPMSGNPPLKVDYR